MSAVLTVTLNPALDLSTATDEVRPGPKLRCDMPRVEPGGGGVNVSRAIRALGGDSTALVALGGATGAQMAALLEGEGLRTERLDAPGDTRQSLAVTDRGTGEQYRFVMPGPVWDDDDLDRAIDLASSLASPGGWVALSGSLPQGLPADVAARLSKPLAERGAQLLADTSGAPLRALVSAPAQLAALRVDHAEAEDIAGRPLTDIAETARFAADLVARGVARAVLLARGAEGNILATAEGTWIASCPKRPVVSAVGAGDSFVAGLLLALSRGTTLPEALRHGAAAASAAVITPGTELCRHSDYLAILLQTVLRKL
jgi:6-phosphofructokinase 2